MIKSTIAALLLSTAAVSAADMMDMDMGYGFGDKQIISLSYVDEGKAFTDVVEGHTDQITASGLEFAVEGRAGFVEYGVAINEDELTTANIGAVIPVGKGFGVIAGGEAVEGSIDDNKYYGGIWEKGNKEIRVAYLDNDEEFDVSGRYYFKGNLGVNAGVTFDDQLGESSEYTIGISLKY